MTAQSIEAIERTNDEDRGLLVAQNPNEFLAGFDIADALLRGDGRLQPDGAFSFEAKFKALELGQNVIAHITSSRGKYNYVNPVQRLAMETGLFAAVIGPKPELAEASEAIA